jgi:hypothetical protein
MILGKSIDKAQIKKIPIRVWSLTDEINATLKALLDENKEVIPEEKYVLIKAFYEATPISVLNQKPKLTLMPGGKATPEAASPAPAIAAPAAANTTAPAPATELDPFEAAMLAEVEMQKAAQNAAPAQTTPTETLKDIATLTENLAPTAQEKTQEATQDTTKEAALETKPEVKTETTPTVAEVPVQAEKPAPVKLATPPKTYTIEDFLNLRKNGIRAYPEEKSISSGHCIIYDVGFDQILFFTEKAFKPGQEVIIEFQIHKTFTVTAKILSITNVGIGSRVISTHPVNYRINAILTHEHLGDRTLLRNFLTKVDPIINTHMG